MELMGTEQLLDIRRRIVRLGSFGGYRPSCTAFCGGVSVVAALVQWWWQPTPVEFVVLWLAAAALGFGVNFLAIMRTYGTSPRRWERSLAFVAMMDLLPAVLAGVMLTLALVMTNRIDLLPGLWIVLFGTGVMSSRRHVPYGCALIGAAFVLAGTAVLYFAQGDGALRPEIMGGTFGAGFGALAVVLARSGS